MESYNFTLQPLFVSRFHFDALGSVKEHQYMKFHEDFFIEDTECKGDIYRAKLKCNMIMLTGEEKVDMVYLYITAYTTFECQIQDDGVDFNKLIEMQGYPKFEDQLREIVYKLIPNLFYMEP